MDRQEVIVPNRNLITSEVMNWTRGDTINRLIVRIGVAFGSNVDLVSELLMQAAAESPLVEKEPAPSVIFAQHWDSSLDFDLRAFVAEPEKMFAARDQMNKAINRILTANDIEIPFPQRDVHVRSSVVGQIT